MAGAMPGRSVGPKVARLMLPLKDGKRLLAGSQDRILHAIGMQRLIEQSGSYAIPVSYRTEDSTSNNHSSSDAVYLNIC